LKQPGAASRNEEISGAVNHFASIRSRGWGANILLRKWVLRLNTDWDAAGAGRSLLQLFQKAKAKICAALNLRNIGA
jgi:hypothetical protein